MADGLMAPVVDGIIQQTSTTASSLSKSTKKSNDALGKEDFLKLLVAQMQYQDPLEPTSNTEYISQFATFSELEQMQNVSNSMDMYRASNLVGQTVIMTVTNKTTGATTQIMGKVDYVMYEAGKAYLSINDDLYSIDDLERVVDPAYLTAIEKAHEIAEQVEKLPKVDKLTIKDREAVEKMLAAYDALSDYEKTFFQKDAKELIESYRTKMKEIVQNAEEADGENDDNTEKE